MKKLLLLFLVFGLFACSSDSDDDDSNNSALLGTWRSVWTCECISDDCELHVGNDDDDAIGCDYDDDCNYMEITFNSNGSGSWYEEDNCMASLNENFEWIVNNNNVIEITAQFIDDFGTRLHPIIVLNDNSMEFVIEMSPTDGWIAKTFWNKVN